jgi:hypothetical protein
MMKKNLKNIFQSGLFVTIGGHDIYFPVDPKWETVDEVFADIGDIITGAIIFSSVVAVIMMIVGGYTLITSAGDPDKTEQGQKTLTGAVIGLVIVWIVWLIIKLVLDFFIKP